MDGKTLRDGIFALHTRRFGTVAEVMIQRLIKCGKGRNLFHDLYDDAAKHRIEVKFSRVRKASETPINADTVLACIEEATSANRLVSFASWKQIAFDCNIQQVKRPEFDVLYYGLFFSDCVTIFRINSGDIGQQIYYSDKQHKGNVGEGQFHINQDTIQIHLDRYLYQTLTYEKLLELLC
ncbi:MAG: hypothetical protein AABZ12_02840 [Planctomycetota bacterium]|mgnify:FL=1